MLLNEDIVDIEKPDGICLLTFVVDEFCELFQKDYWQDLIMSHKSCTTNKL